MRPADFLTVHYDPGLVALSLLIAVMAGYVALDLSRRVGPLQRASRRWFWSAAGSLALGCGIWSMHFVGMLAYSLPIDLGYDKWLTFLSWLEAVGVSAVAFTVLDGGALGRVRHLAGSAIMGAGIAAMHYTGMAAIDVAPGIVWDPWLVAASITIAVVASGAALALSFWLRKISPQPRWWSQGLTAIVIGLAISGMHYTGMAAASFRSNAICGSSGSLSGSYLVTLVGSAALSLLFLTLVSSAFDARAQRSADRLTESLGKANDRLHSANAELLRRALSDPLTNLPNRHHFEDRLEQALQRQEHAQEAKGSGRLAVLFIDLDGFKSVNDTLGHAAGDSVLVRAAHRLQAAARGSDTVARVGGDEFLLLMEDLSDPADAVRMATRLLQSLAEPQEVADRRVEISGSIGIVIHPDQGQRDKLIANADSAMYAAKRAGGNTCAVFEASMEADASRQLGLHSELRHAAERGELRLYYQPKIECRRGQFVGVEALLRWLHPVRGMVGPVEFIPLAERFGLIGSMGQWVIEEACRQMAEWSKDGVRMRVAINLSVHQLREPDLAGRIGAALERHGVASSQLLCEITESVAMEDIAATLKAFDDLASIGVFISIDDFGTGHSSLSYLRKLPARQLKIDRSFISDLETSQDARAVVDAVIRLAHALSLEVVAEGVETEGQRRVLDELGCDQLQGYLFAKPMPAEVLRAWAIGQKPAGSSVDFTASVMHGEG